MKTKSTFFLFFAGVLSSVMAFSPPSPRVQPTLESPSSLMNDLDFLPANPSFVWKTLTSQPKREETTHSFAKTLTTGAIALAALTLLPEKAVATDSFVLQSAAASYAHILSIMAITGCLVAERILISTDMTLEEEETVARIDVLYGLLAALLIGSGFAKAIQYGKGGDFYIHEILFWVKMTLGGVWGGLSIFPTIIFRQRTGDEVEEIPELTDALVARLHNIINAELSGILTIPILASLMSRGVSSSPDFPWQAGAAAAISALLGSFWYYSKEALEWSEGDDEETESSEQFALGK